MKVRLDLTVFLFSVCGRMWAQKGGMGLPVCVCVISSVELACHCSLCITPLLLSSVSFLFLWCRKSAICLLVVMYGISYLLKSFSEGAIEENCTREAIFGLVGTAYRGLQSFSHEYVSTFKLSAD